MKSSFLSSRNKIQGGFKQLQLGSLPLPVVLVVMLLFSALFIFLIYKILFAPEPQQLELVRAELGVHKEVAELGEPSDGGSSAQVASGTDGAPGSGEASGVPEAPKPPEPKYIVHIVGAVAHPGVYEADKSFRINDVLALAGGPTSEADTSLINLAEPIADGMKITIPKVGDESVPQTHNMQPSGGGGTQGGQRININTADESTLQQIPGVGEKTAKAIVDERKKNGPFKSIEDICRVTGIGDKKFEQMKDMICV